MHNKIIKLQGLSYSSFVCMKFFLHIWVKEFKLFSQNEVHLGAALELPNADFLNSQVLFFQGQESKVSIFKIFLNSS